MQRPKKRDRELKAPFCLDRMASGACQHPGSLRWTEGGLLFSPGRSHAPLALQFAILFLLSVTVILTLLGAGPTTDAADLFRQGNAAFDRGDYETALSLYRRAEGKIADPGWLAFNEGAALYRLGRYREAEVHYWLSRQDAAGPRLPRVLYDLGNAVFQQAGTRDAALLQRAIGFYEECLSQTEAEPEVLDNARHNLELARALLKNAKARKDDHPSESNPGKRPAEDLQPPKQSNLAGDDSGLDNDAGTGQRPAEGSEHESRGDSKNPKHQPGVGNLPPVPDSDQPVPLNSEDTSAYLKKASERILKERRGHYGKSASRPSQNIKDW